MREILPSNNASSGMRELEGEKRDIKIVSCVLRIERIDEVLKAICSRYPISGVTLMEVQGFDPRSTKTDQYRGVKFLVTMKRRVRLEVGVPSTIVCEIVQTIREAARTGRNGDGKIFVTDASDVVRVRTGENGLAAI